LDEIRFRIRHQSHLRGGDLHYDCQFDKVDRCSASATDHSARKDAQKIIVKISPRPVYIVQGMADVVAPPDSGERLFTAAGEPRFLWQQEDVPHLSMYLDNPRRYQRRLIDFFDEWLIDE
jgi:hypothetical protein